MESLPDNVWLICEDYPTHVAIEQGSNQLTYQQLNRLTGLLATQLRKQGVEKQDRVLICLENSIEYVLAFYAIWRLGAIAVPVNAKSAVAEILRIRKHSNAGLMIVGRSLADQLTAEPFLVDNVLAVEKHSDPVIALGIAEDTESTTPVRCAADDIAQILFTSGTTGDPKGVVLTHANLAVNTADIIDYLQLTARDSILNVLPFHFSYGNSVLHTHLAVGGNVIVGFQMAFPQQVVDALRATRATGFSGVPTTFRSLLKVTDLADQAPPLRYVTQAGGAMGVDLTAQLLRALADDTQLYVMYGQTEASARISYLPPDMLDSKLGSAGRALKHLSLSVRDDSMQALPAEQIGEVYVQGDNIMQGYWNNPEATSQVLTPHGLKTGDLGYLDSDGYLFITGRKVDMIKVAENRINPLEIEEVICQLDDVLEAAVVGEDDDLVGQRLIACCVSKEHEHHSMAIKRHCAGQLSAYKVPKKILWLDELPKTSSGKIQRYKLKEYIQGVSHV